MYHNVGWLLWYSQMRLKMQFSVIAFDPTKNCMQVSCTKKQQTTLPPSMKIWKKKSIYFLLVIMVKWVSTALYYLPEIYIWVVKKFHNVPLWGQRFWENKNIFPVVLILQTFISLSSVWNWCEQLALRCHSCLQDISRFDFSTE